MKQVSKAVPDVAEATDEASRGGSAAASPAADDQEQGISPVHRGWMPLAGRRRWIEPFVLAMLARGSTYGYAILGRLEEMHITNGPVDVGLIYRTLRDLEDARQVRSSWSDESSGPRRRAYELTEAGYQALDDWAAVMRERARLIGEFNADYLEAVSAPRPPSG